MGHGFFAGDSTADGVDDWCVALGATIGKTSGDHFDCIGSWLPCHAR